MRKMIRAALAVALAALALAATAPASATHSTKTYEGSTTVLGTGVVLAPRPDPTGLSGDGEVNVGGVSFAPAEYGQAGTVRFRVLDVVNPFGQVSLSICQDLDEDQWCGEEDDGTGVPSADIDEPSVSGCLTGGLGGGAPQLSLAGVNTSKEITVFIDAVALCPDGSLGGGTTGQVRAFHG